LEKGIAKIRVVIVDDHQLLRVGLRSVLEKMPDIEVVGEAADGNEAKALTLQLHPDVLLLDLVIPGTRPSEVEAWVRKNSPQTTTLILTGHARDAYLATMLEAGVAGFLSKSEPPEKLVEAIRRAALGQVMFSQDQELRAARWMARVGNRWHALTERERQVLEWMVQGVDNEAIADFMGIAVNTVRNHMRQIFKKLNVKSRNEAIAFVLRHGLLDI
jgi:two-component system, NarL family, response regulator LiaR